MLGLNNSNTMKNVIQKGVVSQTLLGNHLVELKVRQGKNSIPLNQLPQGVYLLYFKKQNIHFKIIKQ